MNPTTDTKKIIAVVAAIVVVALGIYFLSGRKQEAPTGGEVTAPTEQPAPEAGAPGTPAAPGTSPITEEGQVVTPAGEPVKLDVQPGSAEGPQQSGPVKQEQVPAKAIKLTMSPTGISPATFPVNAGQAITLSVTADATQTHVFKFADPALSAVAVGIAPGETRVISFNAPKAGEYEFYCDVPGHKARGEEGKMIVK